MEFEEYVAARGPALLRFAYVITADAHAAQDLTQAALTDAFRSWRRVSRAEHQDAYVRRILLNTHLGQRRRRSAGERPDAGLLAWKLREVTTPDHATELVERDATLRLLETLPPRARAMLVLRYYADLDDTAIAELLGVAPSTVRATTARALTTLRRELRLPAQGAAPEEVR